MKPVIMYSIVIWLFHGCGGLVYVRLYASIDDVDEILVDVYCLNQECHSMSPFIRHCATFAKALPLRRQFDVSTVS